MSTADDTGRTSDVAYPDRQITIRTMLTLTASCAIYVAAALQIGWALAAPRGAVCRRTSVRLASSAVAGPGQWKRLLLVSGGRDFARTAGGCLVSHRRHGRRQALVALPSANLIRCMGR